MLKLPFAIPIHPQNGGLFISRGVGCHPKREISSHELIVVRSGTLAIREDEEDFYVHSGQALLLYPNRLHEGIERYGRDLSFYWVHFDVTPQLSGSAELSVAQLTSVLDTGHMEALCRRFLAAQNNRTLTRDLGAMLLLQMLHCLTEEARRIEGVGRGRELAERAEVYIRTHALTPISTRDVARALQCSPDHLGRVYQRFYSCTVLEALGRERIRVASERLLHSTDRIAKIAEDCGFLDPGYFRRVFQQHHRMSPRAYRQRYAQVHVNTA